MPDIKISISQDKVKNTDYSRDFKSLKNSIRPYNDADVMRELKKIKTLLSKDDDSQMEAVKKILRSLGDRLDSMETSMSTRHTSILKRMSGLEPDTDMAKTIQSHTNKILAALNTKPMPTQDYSKDFDRIEKKLDKNGLPNIIYVSNKQGRTLVPYPA